MLQNMYMLDGNNYSLDVWQTVPPEIKLQDAYTVGIGGEIILNQDRKYTPGEILSIMDKEIFAPCHTYYARYPEEGYPEYMALQDFLTRRGQSSTVQYHEAHPDEQSQPPEGAPTDHECLDMIQTRIAQRAEKIPSYKLALDNIATLFHDGLIPAHLSMSNADLRTALPTYRAQQEINLNLQLEAVNPPTSLIRENPDEYAALLAKVDPFVKRHVSAQSKAKLALVKKSEELAAVFAAENKQREHNEALLLNLSFSPVENAAAAKGILPEVDPIARTKELITLIQNPVKQALASKLAEDLREGDSLTVDDLLLLRPELKPQPRVEVLTRAKESIIAGQLDCAVAMATAIGAFSPEMATHGEVIVDLTGDPSLPSEPSVTIYLPEQNGRPVDGQQAIGEQIATRRQTASFELGPHLDRTGSWGQGMTYIVENQQGETLKDGRFLPHIANNISMRWHTSFDTAVESSINMNIPLGESKGMTGDTHNDCNVVIDAATGRITYIRVGLGPDSYSTAGLRNILGVPDGQFTPEEDLNYMISGLEKRAGLPDGDLHGPLDWPKMMNHLASGESPPIRNENIHMPQVFKKPT